MRRARPRYTTPNSQADASPEQSERAPELSEEGPNEGIGGRVVAGEDDRLNQVEATRKAKCRRFITVCVFLARITWLVTRVTLIGAGTAMWLVVRLVSSRSWPQWLFE